MAYKVAKHPTVEYTDLSESIDLDRIAINIDSAMSKSDNFIVSKHKRRFVGQILINTFKGETKIHGKN